MYLGWKRLVPDYQQAKISLQIMFVDTVSHLFNGFTLCHVNFEAPVVNYLSKRMSCTHVTTSPTLPDTTCFISACLSTTCVTLNTLVLFYCVFSSQVPKVGELSLSIQGQRHTSWVDR